ncbi:Uu.00g026500.m01.CDS01 [Anthostomella pinea]|uniref:Uu.00g026500.m01.CDS01 n=1 Tax=Anthostomella pinea TaxID=933095 RepID=A0AAI8V843_9PEZI|nr:Uu.00g026500.m01.CDS01 [Anthostomella pinea]
MESQLNDMAFLAPHPGHFLGDVTAVPHIITASAKLDDDSVPAAPSSRPFLGDLGQLPTEILIHIVSLLDVCSLVDFRHINQHYLEFVDSLPDFQTVKAFPKLLSAILRLQCRYPGLDALMACIHDPLCSNCKHHGDYLYLLTAERLCYFCFRETPAYVPMVIGPESLQGNIASAVILPGIYGMHGQGRVRQPQLVADRRAVLRQHPHLAEASKDAESERQELMRQNGHSKRFSQKYWPLFQRYTVVIKAPYVITSTGRFEEGAMCRACAGTGVIQHLGVWPTRPAFWGHPFRRYTEPGFRQHLEEFGEVLKTGDGSYIHASESEAQYELPCEYLFARSYNKAYKDGVSPHEALPLERTIGKKVWVPILTPWS